MFPVLPECLRGHEGTPSINTSSKLSFTYRYGGQAYIGPNGEPRLFRPKDNMERLVRSAARVALPVS